MPVEAQDGYQPTPEDELLFRRIRDFIHKHQKRFKQVGAALDRDYSEQALLRREALSSLEKHRIARDNPRMMGVSRAWHRKRGFPVPHPQQRDDGGLKHPPEEREYRFASPTRFANGRRKPKWMWTRLSAAVRDIADLSNPGLHLLNPRAYREDIASRILLITKLLTDPDAHCDKIKLASFQTYGFDVSVRDRESAFIHDLVMPDGLPDPHSFQDHRYDRFWVRLNVFYSFPRVIEWIRWAARELGIRVPQVRRVKPATTPLVQKRKASAEAPVGNTGSKPETPYRAMRDAKWYGEATEQGLYPNLLRTAYRRGLLDGKQIGSRWHYPIEGEKSVMAKYPQYSPHILARLKCDAEITSGKDT